MTSTPFPLRLVIGAITVASMTACAESTRDIAAGPRPELDAFLEVPNPLPLEGATLVVMIRIAGSRANNIGSFTGRINYDTAGLNFVREIALADGITRMSNPTAGLIRTAAIGVQGFGNAPVAAYEFIVRSRPAISAMALAVEELHDVKLGNFAPSLRVLPVAPVIR